MPRDWSEAIADAVTASIDRDEVDVQDLRTIVVAPTPEWLALGVWLDTEWDNYPYPGEDDSAVAQIALDDWLDDIDAIARGEGGDPPAPGTYVPRGVGVSFRDPRKQRAWRGALARFHQRLVTACQRAATTRLAELPWKDPVGIFATASREREALLQAFCHRHGAPAWPLQEHRKEHGYGSAYPWGSFHDRALVVFYPEGEGTSRGRPATRRYKLDDVVRVGIDDAGEVDVRFRDELFAVRFSPGMTHEESGGPDQAAVARALRAGFAPVIGRSEPYELPPSGDALRAWLDGFAEVREKSDAVAQLCRRHDVARVAGLVEAAGLDAAVRAPVLAQLASAHLEAGQPAEGLAALDAAAAIDPRYDRERLRARLLLELGRPGEVFELIAPDSRAAEYRALAAVDRGDRDEALAIVTRDDMKRDEDALAIHALLLAEAGERDAAEAKLRDALLEGALQDPVRARAIRAPALAAVLERWGDWKARREGARAAIRAIEPVPASGPTWRCDLPVSRVVAAPLDEADDRSEKGPPLRAALRAGGKVWAGDEDGRLFELSRDGRRELGKPLRSRAITALAPVAGGIVASDSERLAILDGSGDVLATAQPIVRGDGRLAASGDLVALGCNDAIDIYRFDGQALRIVGTAAAPGGQHFDGIAFSAPSVLCAVVDGRVYFFDLADPADPQPRACLAIEGAGAATASEGVVVVRGDDHAWLLRCSDSRHPEVIGKVRAQHMPFVTRDGDALWLLDEKGLLVADMDAGGFVDRWAVLGREGDSLDPLALWRDGDGLAGVDKAGLTQLAPHPAVVGEAAAKQIADEREQVRELCGRAVSKWMDQGSTIGVIVASWRGGGAELACAGPSSVPGLAMFEPDDEEDLSFAAGAGADAAGDESRARRRQRESVGHIEYQTMRALRGRAMGELLIETAPGLAEAETAGRHVVLAQLGDQGFEVVDVVATRGTAPPRRAAVEAIKQPRTTLERLTSPTWFRDIDTMVARARRDAAFRDEVIAALATRGNPAAARIVWALPELDPDVAARAWIAAADHRPEVAIDGLLDHASRADVRARLEPLATAENPEVALAARRALGRVDELETLEIVRELLRIDAESGRPYPGDIPEDTLAAMSDSSLAQLRDALAAAFDWFAESGMSHACAPLALPLARAGVEPPQALIEAALQEAELERHGDLFAADDPGAAITAVRHFVADDLARRLAEPDDGAPLWPAELIDVEQYHLSWQRFFEIAWPRLDQEGLLDTLHERLAAHVAGGAGDVDRALGKALLLQDLLRGDARATRLGEVLEQAGYPAKELDEVRYFARLGRLQFGWNLVKEARYAEARAVADAALAEAPRDGQALFLDARLAWLERGDPRAAIERIPKALDVATDDLGRGRLYNLYGAALDALGNVAESIPWFERALAADASASAMLLSNIAEAHWKLGDRERALGFAERAARAGATTDIVREILDA